MARVLISKTSITGEVKAFAGISAPEGYLICQGQAVSRATYAELFAVLGTTYGIGDGLTTFNLPDYRGTFLRGLDAGKGLDAGRTLGSYQDDAMQGHKHSWRGNKTFSSSGGGTQWMIRGNVASDTVYSSGTGNTEVISTPDTDNVNGTPRTASESRPKNVSVNYIIKY